MKKCYINYNVTGGAFDAGGKAPGDVLAILRKEGFKVLDIGYLSIKSKLRFLMLPYYVFKIVRNVGSQSLVFFQHPYDTVHTVYTYINSISIRLLKKKGCHCVTILHDIASLRKNNGGYNISTEKEIRILNRFDYVILHSEEMCNYLRANGLRVNTKILELFDYLVKVPNKEKRKYSYNIVFAGNLKKSRFLCRLGDMDSSLHFYLYGVNPDIDILGKNVSYERLFFPEDLSGIKGDWGLVWDGENLDTCNGALGSYLGLNSPHKASMYICAGLPLIVPETSAIASIVRRENIGITVNSIYDIKKRIGEISEYDYDKIISNIEKYKGRLINGNQLRSLINQIQTEL